MSTIHRMIFSSENQPIKICWWTFKKTELSYALVRKMNTSEEYINNRFYYWQRGNLTPFRVVVVVVVVVIVTLNVVLMLFFFIWQLQSVVGAKIKHIPHVYTYCKDENIEKRIKTIKTHPQCVWLVTWNVCAHRFSKTTSSTVHIRQILLLFFSSTKGDNWKVRHVRPRYDFN